MLRNLKNKLAWYKNSLEYKNLIKQHPLRYLFLELTRKCNLKCMYCGSDCLPTNDAEELSSDEWIKIINQISKDFNSQKIMVAVTGGEPLLKEGVLNIFKFLNAKHFPFGVVTNGQLIDDEKAIKIVDTGIGSISISMDAPAELNDELRGEGSSNKVINAVRSLQKAGFRGKLEIISTITKPSVKHLENMRKFISKIRVPLWRLAPVMPIGRALKNENLIPDGKDLKTILGFIKEARKDNLIPKPEFGEEGYLGDEFELEVRPYLHRCRAGITIAGIRSDGRIGACPELADDFIQGDIKKENFAKVWREKYKVFRDRSWTKKNECSSCDAFKKCNGGSLHLYPSCSSKFHRCFYLMLKNLT